MLSPIHTDPAYARWTFSLTVARNIAPITRPTRHTALNNFEGGNFVDLTLRVLVKGARATLVAHDAELPHGTTIGPRIINYGMAIVFTEKLAKFWKKLQDDKCKVKSGSGANNSTHDSQREVI